MTKSGSTWNGGNVLAEIQAEAWDRVLRAAVFFHTEVQKAVNVGNPAPHDKPSLPGEPPRKRTGFLQTNIAYEIDQAAGQVRVGVRKNALYGLFLELGTARMAARPFLLSTLERVKPQLESMLRGN